MLERWDELMEFEDEWETEVEIRVQDLATPM
jgi:hypothetical protein